MLTKGLQQFDEFISAEMERIVRLKCCRAFQVWMTDCEDLEAVAHFAGIDEPANPGIERVSGWSGMLARQLIQAVLPRQATTETDPAKWDHRRVQTLSIREAPQPRKVDITGQIARPGRSRAGQSAHRSDRI